MIKKLFGLILVGLVAVGAFASISQVDTSGVGNTFNTISLVGTPTVNTNTTFRDVAMRAGAKTIAANGNTQWSSDQTLFGKNTIKFDGTTDSLQWSATNDFDTATGNFTLQMWVYLVANVRWTCLFEKTPLNATGIAFGLAGLLASNKGLSAFVGNVSFGYETALDLNVWQHLVLERFNNTVYIYRNGIILASADCSAENIGASANPPVIGNSISNSYDQDLNGYISDFKFEKRSLHQGLRFTPPTRGEQ